MEQGKSDGVILPVKAGNSAGGKDVTRETVLCGNIIYAR